MRGGIPARLIIIIRGGKTEQTMAGSVLENASNGLVVHIEDYQAKGVSGRGPQPILHTSLLTSPPLLRSSAAAISFSPPCRPDLTFQPEVAEVLPCLQFARH